VAGADRLTELAAEILERIQLDPSSGPVQGGPVLVGLSGGADSAVCAWALKQSGYEVHTLYVDHGWPGSPDLGTAAEAVAAALEVEHSSVEVVVPQGPSPEAQARSVRYRALVEHADQLSIDLIATGHTRDDQAETLALNLMRGTGLDGMAGIWPIRGRLIRPMLDISRKEVRELAGLLELKFLDDPTNEDLRIERNRVRAILHELGGDGLTARLARSTQIIGSDLEIIGLAADGLAFEERAPGTVGVPAPALAAQPPAVRRRVIRRALRSVRGPYSGTSSEVERVLQCLAGESGDQQLGEGVTVSRRGPWLWFWVGEFGGNRDIETELAVSDIAPTFYPSGRWLAVFDADKLSRAEIRPARDTDTVEFDNGHKSVSDILAENGIEADRRSGWPVLADGSRIAWVVGARTARWGWVTGSTSRYLYAEAQPGPNKGHTGKKQTDSQGEANQGRDTK